MAQVVRTPAGPVVLGLGPITEYRVERHGGEHYDPDHGPFDWEVDIEKRKRINRMETVCCLLNDLLPKGSARMQCRCRTESIPGSWFVKQIDGDRRRVVFGLSQGANHSVRIAVGRPTINGQRKVTFVGADDDRFDDGRIGRADVVDDMVL